METNGTDRVRVVMWELTRACKLACVHCPIGSQPRRSPLELSTYEAYKTIDQIATLVPDERELPVTAAWIDGLTACPGP